MKWSRIYRDPDLPAEPVRLKKTSTANTEMQVTTIIGVLGRRSRALQEARDCSEQLQPRDHSACKPRPRKWAKGYIRIGTLVREFQAYTPRSGIFSRASLKRLVKFAMQMARVSSTICPSS
jgi:hypothetical protein